MRITPRFSDAEREALVRHALARGIAEAAADFELTRATFAKLTRGEETCVATLALVRSHFPRLGINVPPIAPLRLVESR